MTENEIDNPDIAGIQTLIHSPPKNMISKDFDDLRAYMPKLSFTGDRKMRLINATTPLEIEGKILLDSELTKAFENLEKRRL